MAYRRGTVVEFADDFDKDLRRAYEGRPEEEFVERSVMALEREAMVVAVYDPQRVEPRLKALRCDDGIRALIRKTLGEIWGQEAAHRARFFCAVRESNAPSSFRDSIRARWRQFLGGEQGRAIRGITSLSLWARIVAYIEVSVGRAFSSIEGFPKVPDFVAELDEMPFASFCALNAELEATAVTGYERMLELVEIMGKDHPRVRSSAFVQDIIGATYDETFHRTVFELLLSWFGSDHEPPPSSGDGDRVAREPSSERHAENTIDSSLSVEDCSGAIAAAVRDVYTFELEHVRRPRPADPNISHFLPGGSMAHRPSTIRVDVREMMANAGNIGPDDPLLIHLREYFEAHPTAGLDPARAFLDAYARATSVEPTQTGRPTRDG